MNREEHPSPGQPEEGREQLIQRAEEASGRLAEEWWAADIREVISDLVAALAAAPPAEDAPRCEGDCNPFIAACGARFCDETSWHQHQRTCAKKLAEDAPSLAPAGLLEEIENKFFAAGQMDAQGHNYQKWHIGNGGTVLALSRRLLAEARTKLADLAAPVERKDR